MAREVEIYFKVDGIEQYITNLDDLETALEGVKGATDDVTKATDDLEKASEENFDSLDNRVDTLDGSVKLLAGSLEIATGALNALGLENEFFKAVEENAINVVLLAEGAINVSEGYKLLAQNQKLATIGQRILNAVTKANPYVLLATAIIAAGAALGAYILTSKRAEEQQRKENEERREAIKVAARQARENAANIEDDQLIRDIRRKFSEEELLELKETQEAKIAAFDAEIDKQAEISKSYSDKGFLVGKAAEEQSFFINKAAAIIEEENVKLDENQAILDEVTARLEEITRARQEAADAAEDNADATDLEAAALEEEAQRALRAQQDLEDELFLARQEDEEREQTEAQQRFDERILQAGENEELIKQSEELFLTELAEINARYRQEEKDDQDQADAEKLATQQEINNRILDSELQLQDARLGAIRAGAGVIAQLAPENEKLQNAIFAVDQAAAAAEVVLNLQREMSATRVQASVLPEPAKSGYLAAANGAARLRAGISLATIAALSIARFKGNKGELPPEETVQSVDPRNFAIANDTTTQGQDIQIGGPNGGGFGGGTVRAYVTVNDINSAQEANQQIENLSRL